MNQPNDFDIYLDLNHPLSEYTTIEIHGVRDDNANDPATNNTQCYVANLNPTFYSAYVRHKDGCSEVIIDAGMLRLDDLRAKAKKLALNHGMIYQDHTINYGAYEYQHNYL